MPERIPATPLEKAVLTRPTPEFQDTLIWELLDPQKPDYVRLDYGSDHPDTERYPGYKLVKESAESYTQNRRWWATGFVDQNVYNYDTHYAEESAAHPIYPRVYIQRRDQAPPAIAALVKGTPFTGVWQIRVTNGGTGYIEDNPPTVTVAGNATARTVVNKFGVVVWIVITSEGSGYAAPPAVTIAAPTSGVQATAVASIQLPSAKLVKEDLQELPDDDPRRSIFVRMIRIYETIPGPNIDTYRMATSGNLIRTRRQTVIDGTLPSGGQGILSDHVVARDSVAAVQEREQYTSSVGVATTTPPWRIVPTTDEDALVEIKTWLNVALPTDVEAVVGATSFTINGVAQTLTNFGRRRVPTFPNGLANAGLWEIVDAQVIHSETREIEGSENRLIIIKTAPVPRSAYDFPHQTFTFPAVLAGVGSATLSGGRILLNIAGGVTYRGHRTRSVVACRIRRYSTGPHESLPLTWSIEAPGAGSALFHMIDQNTIHPAAAITDANGNSETFAASTPSVLPTYYLLQASQKVWQGNIFVREYLIVSEAANMEAYADASNFENASYP